MNPQPGEIWLADLGLAAKTRPVVIVSRQDPDPPRALVLYVPLTTQRRDSPYEVPLPRLPFLDRESVANVQGSIGVRPGSSPRFRLTLTQPNALTWPVTNAISYTCSVRIGPGSGADSTTHLSFSFVRPPIGARIGRTRQLPYAT